jgi:predicted membrane-bound mannosyltransferase
MMLHDLRGNHQQVSYWVRKLNQAERGNTYFAYDFEALVVYEAVNHWRCYLEWCS